VCVLGRYWKKKFNIPYVIDMQDPWHSDYYKGKPRSEQPPKYWFSYRLNKYLEPIAMNKVDGIISVSDSYIKTLSERYANISSIPAATITFGAFYKDIEIVKKQQSMGINEPINAKKGIYNLYYVGRGGKDMQKSLSIWFSSFQRGLKEKPELFSLFKMHFIGTSYAPTGKGIPSIVPVAKTFGIEEYVFEQTDRVPFYNGLKLLEQADALLIPGSDDSSYTASKLYPYIQVQKPLIGIFHAESSVVQILKKCKAGVILTLDEEKEMAFNVISGFLKKICENDYQITTDWQAFEPFSAKEMTRKQVELFNSVLNKR